METVENIGSTIGDVRASERYTVCVLRESGAIDESICAIHEASITIRRSSARLLDLRETILIRYRQRIIWAQYGTDKSFSSSDD